MGNRASSVTGGGKEGLARGIRSTSSTATGDVNHVPSRADREAIVKPGCSATACWSPADLAIALALNGSMSKVTEQCVRDLHLDGEALAAVKTSNFHKILSAFQLDRKQELDGNCRRVSGVELEDSGARAWKVLRSRAKAEGLKQVELMASSICADMSLGARADAWLAEHEVSVELSADAQELGSPEYVLPLDAVAAAIFLANDVSQAKKQRLALRYYHLASRNREDGGSRTLPRDWRFQPRISKRLYGARLVMLDRSPSRSLPVSTKRIEWTTLGTIMYDSLAVSARKPSYALLGTPRSAWSKRVNASSGGLHPVEAYAFSEELGGLYHYSPAIHAFETVSTIASSMPRPDDSSARTPVVLFFSVLRFREVWKYGERGLRYVLLDVGHAMAAVSLACMSRGLGFQVICNADLDACSRILLAGEHADSSIEQCMAVAAVNFADAPVAPIDLHAIASSLIAPKQEINPSKLFDALPTRWHLADAAARYLQTPPLASRLTTTMQYPLFPAAMMSEMRHWMTSARSRRSATDFAARDVDRAQAIICLRFISDMVAMFNAQMQPVLRLGAVFFAVNVDGIVPGTFVLQHADSNSLALPSDNAPIRLLNQSEFPAFVPINRNNNNPPSSSSFRKRVADLHCRQDFLTRAGMVFHFFAIEDSSSTGSQMDGQQYRQLHISSGALGQGLYLRATELGLGASGIGCFVDCAITDMLDLETQLPQTTAWPLYSFAIGHASPASRQLDPYIDYHRDMLDLKYA